MCLIKNHGKDVSPMETVHTIKKILENMHLKTVETPHDSGVGVYSVKIDLYFNDDFIGSTNGKGVALDFALASGYAELMERLAFGTIDKRLEIELDPKAKKHCRFIYTPDEKSIHHKDIKGIKGIIIEDIKSRLSETGLRIEEFYKISEHIENIPCIPFQSVSTGEVEYVPRDVEYFVNGTNGICAGNNREEALVQGISELIERYVIYRLIKDRMTPPDIPEDEYMKIPKVREAVTKIREKYGIEIIFKDCSLGEGYPAIAAIIINKTNHMARVNVCSSPIFQVAIERTLTEIFQGYTIDNLPLYRYFGDINEDCMSNVRKCYRNGSGLYPPEFFNTQGCYPVSRDSTFKDYSTNEEYLTYLLAFLEEKGFNVYVCENPYLGFNTYKVYIPGLYNVVFSSENDLRVTLDIKRLTMLSLKLVELSPEERKIYAEISLNLRNNIKVHPYLDKCLPVTLKKDNIYTGTNSFLLMQALNFLAAGDYINSYTFMNEYLAAFSRHNSDKISLVRCLKDVICLKFIKCFDSDTVSTTLNRFYGNNLIEDSLRLLEDTRELVNYFYCMNPEETNCCVDYRRYDNRMYFYIKLKEAMLENMIKRKGLMRTISEVVLN